MKQPIDLQVNDILVRVSAPTNSEFKRIKSHLITRVTKTQAADEDGNRFYQRGKKYYEVGGDAYEGFEKISPEALEILENEIELYNAPIRRRDLVAGTYFRGLSQSKIDRIYQIIKE